MIPGGRDPVPRPGSGTGPEEPGAAPGRILRRALAGLVLGTLVLVLAFAWEAESGLSETLLKTDLEDKASRFTKEARRLLAGSELAGWFESRSPALDRFERLVHAERGGEAPAVFLHLREPGKEVLVFRSPDLVQKLTVSPEGVELMEGDATAIRQVVVQQGESQPRVLAVSQPLAEALAGELQAQAFTSPEARLEAALAEARRDLRRRLAVYAGLGLVLLVSAFATVSWFLARIRSLEEATRRQQHLAYLGTLAGGLVHELRNPLNGIGLNLDLLEEAVQGGEERVQAQTSRYLARIRPALAQLDRIVGEFLDFARPRAGEMRTLDLGSLVREVAEFLEPQARQAGVTLETFLPPDPADGPFRVVGDPDRLRQVVLNLAQNAFQAGGPGGHLALRLARSDRGEVILQVADDGPGVPVGAEERIFGLFYTTREGGTGLGLPIVRRLVEDHGGTVKLEPRGEAPGACFTIRLPAAPVAHS